MLDLPFQKFDVVGSGLALVLVREGEHFIRHIQAVRLARRPNALGGKQDVDPAAGAQIEHNLSRIYFGQGRRISATERSFERFSGNLLHLRGVVKIGSDRIAA